VRRDRLFCGAYDPRGTLSGDGLEARIRSVLEPFGEVSVHRAGPLTVAAATPESAAPPRWPAVPCLADGYVHGADAEASIARAWGEGGLAELRGCFSAVLWDEANGRGALVRDQLGQRPLFTLEAGPVLYFGTEVAPVIGMPMRRPEPDLTAIAQYLSPSELRETRVPFSGVRRVPGGHLVRLGDGRWSRPRPYWVPRYREPFDAAPEELAAETRERIADAIRLSTEGAQHVGILLSGGVDSTSVAAVATEALRPDGRVPHAYSQVFPDYPTADESEQIDAVVARLGLPVRLMAVRMGSVLGGTLEHLDRYAVPEFSAQGTFWRALARHAAADGVDVLLTGEGGDEVFGAPTYLIADQVRQGRLRAALALVERFPNIAYHPYRSLRATLLWKFGVLPSLPPRLHTLIAARNERRALPPYLGERAIALRDSASARPWAALDGPAWWAAKVDHFARFVWLIGAPEQTTRAARLAGVTERHPLLSLDLLEYALRLPPEGGFDAERTRPDLRRATAGLLPDEVRLRAEKVDFDAIRGYSLLADIEIVKELLGRDARIRPLVEPDVVAALLEERPGRWGDLSRWGGWVMRLLTAECWLRQQEDPAFARTLIDSGRLIGPQVAFR
jgi:asparagine synthase (glutamine-hydrolysing)